MGDGQQPGRALLDEALQRLDDFVHRLPDPLHVAFTGFRDRWLAAHQGRTRIAEHFTGPSGTPAFTLLAWLQGRGDLEGAARAALPAAGEAMLCLYFALRCQDDRVDEGADPQLAFLESALHARVAELLAGIAGAAPAFWSDHRLLMEDFAAEALTDSLHRADPGHRWTDEEIRRQGRKFLPMAVPVMAVLHRAGRPDEARRARDLVEHLGTALQLMNDLSDTRRDLESGLRSPLLATLGLVPGRDDGAMVAPAIRRALRDGRLEAYSDRVDRALERAREHLGTDPAELLGRHLSERLTAVGETFRRLALRGVFAPGITADLEITRRCNLRCPACFVFAQEEKGQRLPELETDLALAILDELGGYTTHLRITGGEPFLHRGLWTILERAGQLGMQVSFNTNGSFLDRATVERLHALPISARLLVSIDGPPGVQDSARGDGMTRTALDALRTAHQVGVAAQPATILTSELVDFGLAEWRAYLTDGLGLGEAPDLLLWPIFLRPDVTLTAAQGGHALDPPHMWEAARQVAALLAGGARVTVADYPVINPLLRRLGVPDEQLWQCDAGRTRLAVQADGTITPCHPSRWQLGRLDRDSVHGFVERTRRHPDYVGIGARKHDGCSTCDDQPICGNCHAAVVGRGHDLFEHDGYCRSLMSPGASVPVDGTEAHRVHLSVVAGP